MAREELETINRKANSIRVRNNRIEAKVSGLAPNLENLIEGTEEYKLAQMHEEAMIMLAEQFHEIQELIGMTR